MKKLESIEYIVIHHTGRDIDNPLLIKARHKFLRRWEDIAYHHIIGNGKLFTGDGQVYTGRSELYQGAHAKGYNDKSIGIALMGNFNSSKPTKNQMLSLIELVLVKMQQYEVPIKNVIGHKELSGETACPGYNLPMGRLRRILENPDF